MKGSYEHLRHCERSEAIQKERWSMIRDWIAAPPAAARNDEDGRHCVFARSARRSNPEKAVVNDQRLDCHAACGGSQ